MVFSKDIVYLNMNMTITRFPLFQYYFPFITGPAT